ncbi:cellulose synthase-like protein H1 isoform X2 [Magnolia sinica]|uniref:cellulose synthase-like protein H1 isoform X2 n=1 Tax=Magnolia sinica TaxID=86752 RepID=UPI00265B280A|nr:cellulose synthase-like protein H1 isoform X2 [Magnolia sinica]
MANPISLPLQEKIPRKNTLQRLSDLLVFVLLLSLLLYRFLRLHAHGFVWRLAFLCESWFTFIWILTVNAKWNIVDYKTYPQRLLQRFPDPPAVDMFVTTADCLLEPPIITVNTVLSLLAVDYPPNKLSCYVSDDGCSPITFYSLMEASNFAKLWVPFCRKYDVQVRAPAIYFSTEPQILPEHPSEFLYEWREMKVIWENKESHSNGLPHLIYLAREKRPKIPRNFKAGAMNILTRVSGVMTNAPFILNVDCDMFANNPHIVLHAMCLLLGFEKERESGFVQSPQLFHGVLKDDPFGNQGLLVLQKIISHGIAGIQGPLYGGTGCFHRRKIIYGSHPEDEDNNRLKLTLMNANLHKDALQRRYGCSTEFLKSVTRIMLGRNEEVTRDGDLSSTLEVAKEVAGCSYEHSTSWGSEVGLMYGCATEDVLTGAKIHSMGWSSVYCTPDPPAFLGAAASSGPDYITQQKRWATGLLEILIGKHSPILGTLNKKLRFRQCMAYMVPCIWAVRSLPELCYSMLPAISLLTHTSFLPKVSEPAMWVPAILFVFYNLYNLVEFRNCGLSIHEWWNNQRMRRITSASSWLFAVLSVLLKLPGLSQTIFEVTRKDQNAPDSDSDANAGRFTFDSSPLFLPSTTIVFVHMTALVVALIGVWTPIFEGSRSGLGEMVCSVWVVLNFLPFLKGLFGKEQYGIPWPTVYRAAALAYITVHWCIKGRFL